MYNTDKHIHIEKRLESFTLKYLLIFSEILAVFTVHYFYDKEKEQFSC